MIDAYHLLRFYELHTRNHIKKKKNILHVDNMIFKLKYRAYNYESIRFKNVYPKLNTDIYSDYHNWG